MKRINRNQKVQYVKITKQRTNQSGSQYSEQDVEENPSSLCTINSKLTQMKHVLNYLMQLKYLTPKLKWLTRRNIAIN